MSIDYLRLISFPYSDVVVLTLAQNFADNEFSCLIEIDNSLIMILLDISDHVVVCVFVILLEPLYKIIL